MRNLLALSLAFSPQLFVSCRSFPDRVTSRRLNSATWQPSANKVRKHVSPKVESYVVNGTNIPDVNFDVGESYAGLMPITSGPNDEQQFYFWYFVSPNELASNEILIWLNGGPGASSLEGLLQENGPFLWQFGTFRPVPNPWTWVNLTNVIWVEQPIGTGFTQGNVSAITEEDVAQQFLGFWRNFIDVFDMHNREVYIAGESYAGMFIPYIADAMFTANDTSYFNLQATMMFDPLINNNNVMRQIPTVAYVEEWNSLMGMNTSFVSDLKRRGDECGYTQFLEDNLKYPPSGKLPISPFGPDDPPVECDVWDAVIDAATLVNPCFDIYQIATTCPLLWDVMGFPGTLQYTPQGADVYFDRPDVKRAINAPQVPWAEASPKPTYNTSNGLSVEYNTGIFTSQTVLPSVIDRSKRTVIGHSNLGYILLRAGTLLTIQNMTWGGIQGFQTPVEEDFFVPYHDDPFLATMAGAGIMGKTRTERGLTYFGIDGAGHMVPQYAPSAAYRGLEFLLGRIPSLSSTQPFTSSTSKLEVKRRTQVNG